MKRRSHRNTGFTLIEILVVIGIILVLIGIVFVALKHVGGATKSSATKIDLQNLQSMLAELENAGPLTTTIQFPTNPPDARFVTPYSVTTTLPPALTIPVLGDVTETAYASGASSDRWQSYAVYSTQFVMGRLRSIPQNRQSIQSLPTERFVRAQGEGAGYGTLTPNSTSLPIRTGNGAAHGTPDPPIMADAWGNPIIFVPGGGLSLVETFVPNKPYKQGAVVLYSGQDYRCDIGGKFSQPDTAVDPNQPAKRAPWEVLPTLLPPVTAPGNRPFWASAGADGDFSTPDDNMYSFEQ